MKDFQVYVCRNEHTNYIEVDKTRGECKICGSPISMIFGIMVRGESEDELSRESKYNSDSKSLLFKGITRGWYLELLSEGKDIYFKRNKK